MWSGMTKLPKISLAAFNFYVFTNWPKFGRLLHPCLHLFDFRIPLPPPYCERSKLYINPPPYQLQKILNCVIFILFHNQWLQSALINARKNDLLIGRFSMFLWIQFHNHQLQSALINTRKNVLLMCRKK